MGENTEQGPRGAAFFSSQSPQTPGSSIPRCREPVGTAPPWKGAGGTAGPPQASSAQGRGGPVPRLIPAAGLKSGTKHPGPFLQGAKILLFFWGLFFWVEIPAVAAMVIMVSKPAGRDGLTLKEETFLLLI